MTLAYVEKKKEVLKDFHREKLKELLEAREIATNERKQLFNSQMEGYIPNSLVSSLYDNLYQVYSDCISHVNTQLCELGYNSSKSSAEIMIEFESREVIL